MGQVAAPERLHQPKRKRATRKNLDLRISRVWRTAVSKIELPGKQITVVPQRRAASPSAKTSSRSCHERSQTAPTEWRPSSKKSIKCSARGGIFRNFIADSDDQILS